MTSQTRGSTKIYLFPREFHKLAQRTKQPGKCKTVLQSFYMTHPSNTFNDEKFSLSKRQVLNQKLDLSALYPIRDLFPSYPEIEL